MTNQYNSDLESQLAKLKHLLKEAQDENTRLAETNQREIELHKKEVAQREALENVVAQISSELDLDKVLESIIAGAVTLMGQPTQLVGVVSLVNEQDDRIFVRAEIGAKESWMSYSFTRGEGLTGLVWERGEPIITDSYDKLPRALAPELISSRGPGIGVPIFWQGKIIGVFSVISLNFQRRFTQTNANLMTLFARHAAIAIANARLYAQSQELAIIEERNRLARELHDSVTQLLYSMTLTSRAAKNFLAKKPERVVAQLESLEELSRQALAEMRALLLQLHPRELEDEGLLTALRRLLSEIGNRHNLITKFEVECYQSEEKERIVPPALTPKQEQAIYRIAQEGLANIIKHSHATRVEMVLDCTTRPDTLYFKLRDNGVGLSGADSSNLLASGGLGLRGMRERVQQLDGELELTTGPEGHGTLLIITLPLIARKH